MMGVRSSASESRRIIDQYWRAPVVYFSCGMVVLRDMGEVDYRIRMMSMMVTMLSEKLEMKDGKESA